MPTVIAHRGFNHVELGENSRAAFAAAIAAGITWLELDLRASKDGVLLLSHDASLARLSGHHTSIADTDWLDLSQVKLKNDARLLTFAEFAVDFAGANWTLDIKPETGSAVIAGLKEWANSESRLRQLRTRTKFLFWDAKQEWQWRAFLPDAEFYARRSQCYFAGVSILAGFESSWTVNASRTYSVLPRFFGRSLFEAKYVNAYHAIGAKVLAFLPQNAAEFEAARAAGVDEILVDCKLWPS
jgi:glycerophosphoryl diester phosphodiesterase